MTDTLCLDILPYEVLLTIFDYCDAFDLVRLSEVCKRFYEIVRSDAVWIKKSRGLLVTNQTSERFRKRCNPVLLSPRTMWLVSYNWQYGRYDRKTLISNEVKIMPWLQMTSDTLWWSGGNRLYGIKRSSKYFAKEKINVEKKNLNNCYSNHIYGTDICKFVLCGKYIISGHCNGDIQYWLDKSDKGSPCVVKILRRVHPYYINGIDATSQNVISGSINGMIKIQKNVDIEESNFVNNEINIDFMDKIDRVQSLAIDPTGTRFAVGSSGTTIFSPLHLINIETLKRYAMFDKIRYPWRHGAGILDMVWDNPQTLLTCSYDTFVRKWDLRTEKCVASWADPNDTALYCISSDHQYSIITGTQLNCAAVLWDQRMCNFVQLYFINSRTLHLSSPIYSLQFDSSHLYCALDRRLVKLSFSGKLCHRCNYKQYY